MDAAKGFQRVSPVRRKPLPRNSRHSSASYDGSFDGDAYPLVSIDDRLNWSLTPLTAGADTTIDNEASKHLGPSKSAQTQPYGTDQHEQRTGRYSRLSSYSDRKAEAFTSQMSIPAWQNSIPRDQTPQNLPRMWNSIWLRQVTLEGFVVIFLSLLAGLIILWHFARVENGIETNITHNHYAWTYGPTALLVVIGAGWRQVDFHCRTLAPWAALRRGSASGEKSLLLDYTSPILPKTLVTAARHRDWAVLASGIGVVLLRIVIVFSTGLLVLTPTSVSRTITDAIVNSRFAGTNYTVGPAAIDTEVMQYYGIQERGMQYQYGTSATVAYNTLDLTSLHPNATVTATVDGVFPFFDCEIVSPKIVGDNFTWITNTDDYPPADELDLRLTLSSSRCPPLMTYYQLCTAPCSPVGRVVWSQDGWNDPYSYNYQKPLHDLDPCANLYYLSIIDITIDEVTGHPRNTSKAWNVTLQDQVGIVCSLGYTVDKVNVTINTADPTSNGGVNTSSPLQRVMDVLPGFSYQNLSADFQNEVVVNNLPKQLDAPKIFNFPTLFVIKNGGSATALLNASTLKDTAEEVFRGLGVQMAHSYLRRSDNSTTAAKVSSQEQRLQIRKISLWAMVTGFILLAVSAAAVLIWRAKDVVPCRPSCIGGQATILAASPALQELIETALRHPPGSSQNLFQNSTASSHVKEESDRHGFVVDASLRDDNQEPIPADPRQVSWWRPMSTRSWFMLIALALPLTVIAVLEVLQHESDTNQGLINVSSSSTIDHSLPTILASAVVLSIAMLYDALDFAVATLAPYQALTRGSASANRTLFGVSFGNLPVWSTVLAIRERHVSAAVTSVATLLGSVLTIVASGLYTVENVSSSHDVSIVTSDRFVPSFGTSTDNSAGAIFELIEQNNASYPDFTYDGLVFPHVNVSSLGAEVVKQLDDPAQSVTLRADIVAMRASLNCTLVPRDIMNMTMVQVPSVHADPYCLMNVVTFNASLPASCPHFLNGENQTVKDIALTYEVQHTCDTKAGLAIHEQVVLNLEGAAGDDAFESPLGNLLGSSLNPPGCPSLAFLSGYFIENVTSTENITAMTCIQGLEEVETETVFTVVGDSFQIRSAPKVDESSARWLQAFSSVYWFTNINTFAPFNRQFVSSLSDYFYAQVNYGPDGIPPQELTGPSNTQRFMDVTQSMYRRYMAQLISATMRKPLDNGTKEGSARQYSGTVSGVNRMRLKQHATSKLILQIFLGVMFVCGAFVYSRQNMRCVLLHCPWSIFGTMSLLVGSEMIERSVIPVGSEFMDDRELKKVFEGYVFSLGWWNASGERANSLGKEQRFGIDIGKADAVGSAYLIKQESAEHDDG